MKDQYGREINYLRVSITDLCNLRCQYCMPESGVEKKEHSKILSFEEIIQIVNAAVELGINKIRITGGEPLVRKGVVSLIHSLSKIEGIKDLAMTTNGILLKEYAKDLKDAGLNRVNVSLDTLREDRYNTITRGGNIENVMEGLEAAMTVGLTPLKINTVVIKNFNDDEIMDFAQMTLNLPIDVRFIELMPIGQVGSEGKLEFMSNKEIRNKLKDLVPENTQASVARNFKFPGAAGRIGFINPISSHFCEACNKLRLTADGKMKTCLHNNDEIDLKSILFNEDHQLLKDTIKNAIVSKPERHHLNEKQEPITRDMNRIGG